LRGKGLLCSDVRADNILATARVTGQGDETGGLGLFLIPRRLSDGTSNHLHIQNLCHRLGTRSLATGEIVLQDAVAHQVGPVPDGFRNLMTHVMMTSRTYSGVGAAASARRAYSIAQSYVQQHRVLGQAIVHNPLVQMQLAEMRCDAAAIFAGSMRLAHVQDQKELGSSGWDVDGFLRVAVLLNKLRSAEIARGVILQAIHLLGANGADEGYSPLPRLLRDTVAMEALDGTQIALLDQVQRDMRRLGVHNLFLSRLRIWIDGAQMQPEFREQLSGTLNGIASEIEHVLGMDVVTAAIYFQALATRLCDLYYTVCLVMESDWELTQKKDRSKQRVAQLFFGRRAMGMEPKDFPYFDDHVARLAVERTYP
jgi:acyl-CoA dehydrogenase